MSAAEREAPGGRPRRRSRPCTHCGAAVEVDEDDAGGDVFCCSGCEAAAAIIRGAGLERYYAEREAPAPRPGAAEADAWPALPAEELPDGTRRVRLHVDGLHCSACVWVTEKVMERTPGVHEAFVSYATGRAELRWDPEVVDLSEVLGKVAALGYRPRALGAERPPDRDLLLRLGVAVFAAANVMMLSAGIYLGWWSGMAERHAALLRGLSLVLATPVATWSAALFFRGAIGGLRNGVLHMDLPLSVAVAVMYGHGLWAVAAGRDTYLDSLTMLVALLLGGRLLEQRGRARASEAARALAGRAPRTARRVRGEAVERVAAEALKRGDLVEVAAGEEVPADGRVEEGEGTLERALLTGESRPVRVRAGDRVVAGSVLEEGQLRVRVLAAGTDTLLARMARGLEAAADRPAEPTLADRIAPHFTATTLGLALVALVLHGASGGFEAGMRAAVAVLVVACPCALSLAHPLAAAAGIGAAARRGLLLRDAGALGRMAEVDLVALDKTGTVTGGRLAVVEADDEVLRVAAGIERASTHPVARAVVDEAVRRGIPIPRGREVVEEPGRGVSGVVDGRRWTIRSAGPGVVEVVGLGRIVLRDALRPDTPRVVADLRDMGLDVALLSGDHPEVAARIAEAAHIARVEAAVGPEEKAAWLRARRAEGRRPLFAGDGVNDGPALVAADVGVAMATGAASTVLAADAVVAAGSIGPIRAGIAAARAARHAQARNLRRSLAYNAASVALALAGWVNPLVAAVLMPLSSALVVAGALGVEREVGAAERRWRR